MDEQLFWARRLKALGLAGNPLPAKAVTARDLAIAITETLKNKCRLSRARDASLSMQRKDSTNAYSV